MTAEQKHTPGAADAGEMKLKAPFPYFGGKSRIAAEVWRRFGDVKTYVEPFCGSCAVLLARPGGAFGREIVNDYDGHIANVWRALQADPEGVAKYCDWPCNHIDLMARRAKLNADYDDLRQRLIDDPEWFDVKMAGYYVWCASVWIGSGLTRKTARPNLTDNKGVMSAREYQVPRLTHNEGIGARGVFDWMCALQVRLHGVRVVCGDWTQVLGGNWRTANGACAVFLDPPYSAGRDMGLYHHDSDSIAHRVRRWCVEHGDDPLYRIALCGHEGEHDDLEKLDWEVWSWVAQGGYGNLGRVTGRENRKKERVWFSPHCLQVNEGTENEHCAGKEIERGLVK